MNEQTANFWSSPRTSYDRSGELHRTKAMRSKTMIRRSLFSDHLGLLIAGQFIPGPDIRNDPAYLTVHIGPCKCVILNHDSFHLLAK